MTIGVAVVTFLAGRVSVAPLVTMISTSRRTNSAARSGRRLFLPSAYRYSMTMFCPSIHPRSRSPCWNALCQGTVSEAENGERMPIRAIFFDCCADADGQSARSMAHRAKLPSFRLFISPSRTAVLVLCLNLGNIHLPLSAKKQMGLEIVGLSCQ